MVSSLSSFIAKLWTVIECGARAALRAPRGRTCGNGVGRGAALAVVGAAFCCAPQWLHAQCDINLLANPGFELAGCNPGYETQYLCWEPDPGRGYFTVGTNPAAWNPWFNSCTDHTPTGNRMMMLDGTTGVVAWAQTVTNLQPNVTYRFRFWTMDLYNQNPAVLRVNFRPEPNWQFTQVPPSFPVQITGCTWQKADFFWTCNPSYWGPGQPRNMTIVLDNTTPGETGVDFALDDMEFKVECWSAAVLSGPPPVVTSSFGGSVAISVGVLTNSCTPMELPLPTGYSVAWSHDGVPVGAGAVNLTGTGSFNATLNLSNLGAADRGLYTFTVTTPCGTTVSSPAWLRFLGNKISR